MPRAFVSPVYQKAPIGRRDPSLALSIGGRFAVWTGRSTPAPGSDGIGAEFSLRIEVRYDNGPLVRVPIFVAHRGHVGLNSCGTKRLFGIRFTRQRLHLKQWEIGPEAYWLLGSGKTKVREKRPKPAIRFDDPFVEAIAAGSGKVRRRPDQEAPIFSGTSHQARPDLQNTGLRQGGQERRRATLQRWGRLLIECVGEIRELRGR